MPVKFNPAKFKTKAKDWVTTVGLADLSMRADAVVAAAQATDAFTDDTGDLRKSIHKERFSNPRFLGYRIVADAVHEGVAYGKLVELGHPKRKSKKRRKNETDAGNVPPHPFLVPALAAARSVAGGDG